MTASKQQILTTGLKGILVVLVIDAGFALYQYTQTGENIYKERYFNWFRLTPVSTVHEFRAAGAGFRSRWLDNMCDDGACLHPVDWKCGFSISTTHPDDEYPNDEVAEFDRKTRACFLSLVAKAPLADTLGKLRILCGRRYMVFTGNLYYSEKDCEKVGGKWGAKAAVFGDESTYFESAP